MAFTLNSTVPYVKTQKPTQKIYCDYMKHSRNFSFPVKQFFLTIIRTLTEALLNSSKRKLSAKLPYVSTTISVLISYFAATLFYA